MMQLAHYTRAMLPEPFTVLGCRLKPFCLGHYFLMNRFDCAFASDGINNTCGIVDLLLAVTICSRTSDEFIAFVSDDKAFNAYMKKWSKHIQRSIVQNKLNFMESVLLFQKYMRDGVRLPAIDNENNDSNTKVSGAHWSQSVLSVLMSEYGCSEKEALNMPLSKALSDYCKFLEKNGSITFTSDEDLADIEAQRKALGIHGDE